MRENEGLFEEKPICYALGVNSLLSYCHGCLAIGSHLRKCSGCRLFVYCSPECQKKDWKLHKNECASGKRNDGVPTEDVRLVQRLAVKWAHGDMGETVADGVVRSLTTLEQHSDTLEEKACQFLDIFRSFFDKRIVSDEVIKRLCKIACVNSFSLTNEYSTTIGISLCIRLSAINHSCAPNVRYAYRQNVAVMVPTDSSQVPSTLKEAKHSYIDDLLPRNIRREILKRDYNFDCKCDGCVDEDRNNRMESWHCVECAEGWLPPGEASKCMKCGWRITIDHFELCRMAEETTKSSCDLLRNVQYKLESRISLAEKVLKVCEEALHDFNVRRIPALRVLYEHAVKTRNTEDMLKYGKALFIIHEQYQNKDDLAFCHLKYGMAQVYKSMGNEKKCRELLEGVRDVFQHAYGANSRIVLFVSLIS